MADKNRNDQPPPPLLLMPASQGLTLNPTGGSSLLMPVPQTEASLLAPEEEGEADSFVGQTTTQQTPYSYFQSPPAAGSLSDPFANIGQPDHRATPPRHTPTPPQTTFTPQSNYNQAAPVSQTSPPGVQMLPPGGQPLTPLSTAPPSRAPAPNQYRMYGSPRYAQPPPGTYSGAGPPPNTAPPTDSPFPGMPPMPPPNTGVPPIPLVSSGALPQCAPPPAFPGGPPVGPPPTSIYPTSPPGSTMHGAFTPVMHHWFYCKNIELRQIWLPFSITDSIKMEDVFRAGQVGQVVSVEGGRYDVDITQRMRHAVYWEEVDTRVRRCSWFFKNEGDHRFVPYEEDFSERLEEEYKVALTTNTWHKRIELENGETIIMHNPGVVVHFRSQPDDWGNTQGEARPKVVKRGIDDFDNIEDGEPTQVDHVVFVVHGIGSTCDLRFRNIVECVDDFRSISLQMLQSHFRSYQDEGRVGRVEFLPVRWHAALHGDATGIDRRLKGITLNSIGKLRHFTNDTLLDILFYASPAYCQNIIDTVCMEINRLFQLFRSRNPGFRGNSSVAGHSLGSLVLFDLLNHQGDVITSEPEPVDSQPTTSSSTPSRENTPSHGDSQGEAGPEEEKAEDEVTLSTLLSKLSLTEFKDTFEKEQIDMESLRMCEESDLKDMGVPLGPRKKLLGYLKLQKAKQKKKNEEAERRARLESERQMREEAQRLAQESAQRELASRASNAAGNEDSDPLLRQASNTSVNYVVSGVGTGLPLVRYPQLDFPPTHFFALGSPIAMFQTVRGVEMLGDEYRLPTCSSFFNIFHPFDPVAYRMEPLIVAQFPPKPVLMPHHKGRKRLHLELKESLSRMGADIKQRIIDSVKVTWKTINDFALAHRTAPQELSDQDVSSAISQLAKDEDDKIETGSIASSIHEEEVPMGQLNQGRRIDYVLQEKPIESFNDYLFALGSHACYWESEDTVLMILKEIYALMGIAPQGPRHPEKQAIGPPPRTPYLHGCRGSSPTSPQGVEALPIGQVMSLPQTSAVPMAMGQPPHNMTTPLHGMASPPHGMTPPPHGMTPPPHGMTPPPQGMAPPPQGMAPPPQGMAPPPQGTALPPYSGPPPLTGFVRK